jgi:hypothetical protein
MLFNNTKLERAIKRRSAKAKDGCETSKFIRKRSTVEKVGVAECFYVKWNVTFSELREAMTMQLKDRLNRCALALQDEKLIAKASSGDVVAQELKYHPKCLTALYEYNRERKVLNDREYFEEKREEHTMKGCLQS